MMNKLIILMMILTMSIYCQQTTQSACDKIDMKIKLDSDGDLFGEATLIILNNTYYAYDCMLELKTKPNKELAKKIITEVDKEAYYLHSGIYNNAKNGLDSLIVAGSMLQMIYRLQDIKAELMKLL